jgi:hypothetical protein
MQRAGAAALVPNGSRRRLVGRCSLCLGPTACSPLTIGASTAPWDGCGLPTRPRSRYDAPAGCSPPVATLWRGSAGGIRVRTVTGVFGAGRRTRRLPRALLFGAVRLLVALAVLFGTVQAGARYFYCEGFGLSASDPCAAKARGGEPCPFNSVERQSIDCCALITIPSIPDGARAHEHAVHPAGVVAVMPAGQYASGHTDIGERRFARRAERWQKPPRPSGEIRAQLMVFLT